jgi:hypothetical protein
MPTLSRVRVLAKRAVCGTNLNAAAKGLNLYATEHKGRFPTCGYGATTSRFDVMGKDVTSSSLNPPDSNSRNLFLAVRLQSLEPDALICPATDDEPAYRSKGSDTYYDFKTGTGSSFKSRCSYSYHLQFSNRSGGGRGYPLTKMSHGSMALLADKNPFVTYKGGSNYEAKVEIPGGDSPGTKDGNSKNHGMDGDRDGVGQNVAYLDAHVVWTTVPTAGLDGDNIYTVWDGNDKSGGTLSSGSMPKGKTDSILVP